MYRKEYGEPQKAKSPGDRRVVLPPLVAPPVVQRVAKPPVEERVVLPPLVASPVVQPPVAKSPAEQRVALPRLEVPQRGQSRAQRSPSPGRYDEVFARSDVKFKDGFDQLKSRQLTGLCMLRVSNHLMTIEVGSSEGTVGEEICRHYFNSEKRSAIERFIEKSMKQFLQIVSERQHDNFAIAIMGFLEKRFVYEFSCNKMALAQYHWSPKCIILHVEVPKFHDKSDSAVDVELSVRKGVLIARNPLIEIYRDGMDNYKAGRIIFACEVVETKKPKYLTLYDDTPNLMKVVLDRGKDVARENVIKNQEMKFAHTVADNRNRGNDSLNSLLEWRKGPKSFDEALYYLRHCSLENEHIFIYIGRLIFAVETYNAPCFDARHPQKVFEFERRSATVGPIVDTKNKVDAILKALWLNKVKQYTLVFRGVTEFSITLRLALKARSQFRHYWNEGKNYAFLTVVHSELEENDEVKEFQLNVKQSSFERQLEEQKFSALYEESEKRLPPKNAFLNPGVRKFVYSTQHITKGIVRVPLVEIIAAVETRNEDGSPSLPPI